MLAMLAGAELVCWCRPGMSAQRPSVTAPLPWQGPVASRDTPILSSRAGPGRISASLRYGTPGSTGRLAATPRLGPGLRSDAEIHATAGAGTACARSQNKTDYFGSIREDANAGLGWHRLKGPLQAALGRYPGLGRSGSLGGLPRGKLTLGWAGTG